MINVNCSANAQTRNPSQYLYRIHSITVYALAAVAIEMLTFKRKLSRL